MLSVRWILPIPCQGAFHRKSKRLKLESVLLMNLIAVPFQQPLVCVTFRNILFFMVKSH
jgi:hypothetical protein